MHDRIPKPATPRGTAEVRTPRARARRPRLYAVVALGVVAALSPASASAQSTSSDVVVPRVDRPRLVVMVVVDQFRAPYLMQYDALFTGGVRRLLDRGRVYLRASHDHAVTETAPGHASLATGVHPDRHGIVANEWSERSGDSWVTVSNVGDSSTSIVGAPSLPGVSPWRQRVSGLADWIAAADRRAIIASVSAKDRGAVRPAGLARGHVYWFDARVGRFVTSTYYRERYPGWVERFNRDDLGRYAKRVTWEESLPPHARAIAPGDSADWEGDGSHTQFPHRAFDEFPKASYWTWFLHTPFIDAATVDFAARMVGELRMGADDATDFLNVSLSATDFIGHRFGPMSREQLENLLQLDRALGGLFSQLDDRVGRGRWVLGLSADHGSMLAPETLPRAGEGAGGRRGSPADYTALRAVIDSASRAGRDEESQRRVAAMVRSLPFVASAHAESDLDAAAASDSFALLATRSRFPGRLTGPFGRLGVVSRFAEGWLATARGSSHGTPYWYDRHVPLIFLGPGVEARKDTARASTVDFAPTLARLAGLTPPSRLDGRPLQVGAPRSNARGRTRP